MAIPNTILYNPAPSFLDDNGNPLDSGRLRILNAGTQVLKDLYADNTQTTPITNPVRLGSGGITTGGVWIPEGNYDFYVDRYIGDHPTTGDPEFANLPSRSRFNIAGAGSVGGGSGSGVEFIDSIEDLRALLPDTAELIYVAGYYGNDGIGGGLFRWVSTATAIDDGGSVFSPNGAPATGRWFRVFEGSDIFMEQWGCRGGLDYSNASAVENMITFAKSNLKYRCVLNKVTDDWYLNGNVDFDGKISVLVKNECRFTGLTGVHTLTFSCDNLEIEGENILANQSPSPLLALNITSKIQVKPQWWDGDFALCVPQSGDNDIIINSTFSLTEATDFTGRTLIKEGNAVIGLSSSSTIIDKVISDSTLFSGDYSGLSFINGEVDGDWFAFDNGVDIDQWSDFMNSLSRNGEKVVNWRSGEIVFTDTYAGNTGFIEFNILPLCTFVATGAINVQLPTIISKSTCIDNTSTGLFSFLGTTYLSQFGALINVPSSIKPAIEYAISCGASVDLDGESYRFDESIDFAFNASKISNGTLLMGAPFTGSYGVATSANASFNDLSIDVGTNTSKRLFVVGGIEAEIDIKGGVFTADDDSTEPFYDSGTLSTLRIDGATFPNGILNFTKQTKLVSISNCFFDNSKLIFLDPDHVSIIGNNFYKSGNVDSIEVNIPVGQVNARAGIVIKGNNINSANRDTFFKLTDGNGNLGANYHIQIEGNTGTDISSVYEFTLDIDLSLSSDVVMLDSSAFNIDAMISSGFFIATQFNWGSMATQTTSAYVSNAEADYITSGTLGQIALQYRVENPELGGTAKLTGSYRRTV